ncbi:hypothetical protein [Streptomyces sp. NPDC013187]|uniref:hypothetical protein n=1 Tax=Streptomyces sp. NPDC013187 TaxID=3364865 RepID=UPI0036BA8073
MLPAPAAVDDPLAAPGNAEAGQRRGAMGAGAPRRHTRPILATLLAARTRGDFTNFFRQRGGREPRECRGTARGTQPTD